MGSETAKPTTHTGLDQSSIHFLMRNKWELEDLPEPGRNWSIEDTDISGGMIRSLTTTPIITVVEPYHDGYKRQAEYRTDRRYYVLLEQYLANTEALLPCGHSSIQNPRDIDGIRCGICEMEFAKDEVRQ